jgi:hypothetical protein
MRAMKLRPRFSLRTRFVLIALISIPLSWAAYQVNWIRQRNDARRWIASMNGQVWRDYPIGQSSFAVTESPWPIRLFGEESVFAIEVSVPDAREQHKQELQSLFPESKIAVIAPDPEFSVAELMRRLMILWTKRN